MEYDNTNRGTLGKNNNPKSDKSPEYTGKLNIEGKEYWLSGWVKTSSKDGSKFFSLTVNPKDEQPQKTVAPKQQAPGFNDLDDDLPF